MIQTLIDARTSSEIDELLSNHIEDIGPFFFDMLAARTPLKKGHEIVRRFLLLQDGSTAVAADLFKCLLDSEPAAYPLLLAEASAQNAGDQIVEMAIATAEMAITSENDPALATRSMEIARTALKSDGRRRASLELVSGNFELKYGDPRLAEDHFVKAERSLTIESAPEIAGALIVSRGYALLDQRRLPDAASFYERNIHLIADEKQKLFAKNNLAWIYACLGRFSTAINLLETLQQTAKDKGFQDILADVFGNLAVIANRLDLGAAEESYLFDAHELRMHPQNTDQPFNWGGIAQSCTNIASFYARRSMYDCAEHWIAERRKALAHTGGLVRDEVVEQRLRLSFALARKDKRLALSLATPVLMKFLSDPVADMTEEEMLLVGNAGVAALINDQYASAHQIFERLSEMCEAARSNDLLSTNLGYLACCQFALNASDSAKASLDRMLEIERQLRHDLRDPFHQFSFSAASEALHDDLVNVLTRMGETERLFEVIQLGKAFAISVKAEGLATCEELLDALAPASAFLEYDHHGAYYQCIVLCSGHAKPYTVELDIDIGLLEDLIGAFEDRLGWARYVRADLPFENIDRISELLLQPVLASLPDGIDELILAPAGLATRLPFHILPIGDGLRLIDKYAVSFAPNATSWLTARRRSRAPIDAAVLAYAAKRDDEIVRRFFSEEGQRVSAVLQKLQCGGSGNIIAATSDEDELLAGLKADILHVAAHGSFSPSDPKAIGVLLGKGCDEKLIALDVIAGHQSRSELIFLSGCDTGRVSALRNQEILGLMSVLLGQGVVSTIASFWPVPATSHIVIEVVELFYQSWVIHGLPKAKALRRAMLAHRTAPIYEWAAFGLFGFGSEISSR